MMYNIMEVAGIQYSDSQFWLFFKKKLHMYGGREYSTF